MTYFRLIAPDWLLTERPTTKKVLEGEFSEADIKKFNGMGYNIYYLPNGPSSLDFSGPIAGNSIDRFDYVFVDFDLKSRRSPSKLHFVEAVEAAGIPPTRIVDSGGGVHVYWRVTDLDAKAYLRLTRRLVRLLNTDEAVGQILQLMRYPGTLNTKKKNAFLPCEIWHEDTGAVYTAEELDKLLPPISKEDEQFCEQHYTRTYSIPEDVEVADTIPPKFGKLLRANGEAKEIWAGSSDDRSRDDYRLGHIMYANDFTKEEAAAVLVNSAKAMKRAPVHRVNYARNIVDKIWTYEESPQAIHLSPTVRQILSKDEETLLGARFPCHRLVDDTHHGFRLGQVIGIIGGSGVGKTTLTLNMFLWFAANNPDYHHFFFSLEQPPGEVASRIRNICGGNETLFDKIHVVSNYSEDGTYKNFSLADIEEHLSTFQTTTKHKVGATVIDHIGVLSKNDKNGENDGLIGICHRMKATAVRVNTMLIMLSQAPREKAGIGDIELNKDAAYGTVFFESYCDYCICMWQPLKRAYTQGAPTVMAFKFAKIRHKKQKKDRIQEDTCYQIYFDPDTERLRELTQDEEQAAKFYLSVSTNLRKLDRKTEIVPYKSRKVDEPETDNADRTTKH